MSQFLLDTNCLLSYLTNRSPQQHSTVLPFIDRARRLEATLHVTPIAVTELVYVLGSVYGQSASTIGEIVTALLDSPGIEYVEAHPIDTILELWPAPFAHYADAALAAVAKTSSLTLLTFDRAFARALNKQDIQHQLLS